MTNVKGDKINIFFVLLMGNELQQRNDQHFPKKLLQYHNPFIIVKKHTRTDTWKTISRQGIQLLLLATDPQNY